MKNYLVITVIILCFLKLNLFANDFEKSKLPKLLGTSSAGTEFYFSFIPAWETSGASNELKIYVSSNTKTKVRVEVVGKQYAEEKITIPNGIIEFTLTPLIGQAYSRHHTSPPKTDSIFKGAGIHVLSDDPILCYGVTQFQYLSDGFMAIPVNALGKEYIVSSFADVSENIGQWLPSISSITAAFDNTEVKFTMGGTDRSTTAGGLEPGKQSIWNLEKGDVLLISSLGSKAELSGSRIETNNPVAVVSGNFCAYVPTNCGCGDLLEEMELPTDLWGTEYHVTNVADRLKNSMIKIFAKEPNTNIFRDYEIMGFIRDNGGISGIGYLDMRADDSSPRPIVISGDKPISVTQYNCSRGDDGIGSYPFQMVLIPTELYSTNSTFITPCTDSLYFKKHYINICYKATEFGTIPDDLEFAKFENDKFNWMKLIDISANPGSPFSQMDGGVKYYLKTIKLDEAGVYSIRAKDKFQAYSYGFALHNSYGFPSSIGNNDLFVGNNDSKFTEFINSVIIYPNPANDILMLENIPDNCDEILIFNETGKQVKEISLNSKERLLKISIKDLSQGHYILRVNCDGNIIDKKFIIER
jgi:hypothetical protein